MKTLKYLVLIWVFGLAFQVTCAHATGPIPIKACQTISEPGSYVLKGNLTVTENQPCLVVDADFVTIDLGGYTLTGPGLAWFGTYGLDAYGIWVPPLVVGASIKRGIVVRNGTVTGFTYGVFLYPTMDAVVENVRALNNYRSGIRTGSGATVRDSVANGNNFDDFEGEGIEVGANSIILNSTANDNGHGGIWAGDGCVVSGNIANSNGGNGISTGIGCTVSGNTASSNGSLGMQLYSSGQTVMGNSANHNDEGGMEIYCPSNIRGNTFIENQNWDVYQVGVGCNLDNNVVNVYAP